MTLGDGKTVSFPIDAFARFCLLNGKDELAFLLEQEDSLPPTKRSFPSHQLCQTPLSKKVSQLRKS